MAISKEHKISLCSALCESSEDKLYLSQLVQADIDEDGQPDGVLRVLREKSRSGSDVLIEFGFEKNRVARLQYSRKSYAPLMTTTPDMTGNFGAAGREHNQWVKSTITGAEYLVEAQTSADGKVWYTVGESITIIGGPVATVTQQVALGKFQAGIDTYDK